MRVKFENIMMEFATSISKRSTCSRRQVGCVITSTDFRYVYGIGYNGNATSLNNGCDEPDVSGSCGCLHAEENAIINCCVSRETAKYLFSTVFPCSQCAKRIINLGGVKKVFFKSAYHDFIGGEIFSNVGINIEKIN